MFSWAGLVSGCFVLSSFHQGAHDFGLSHFWWGVLISITGSRCCLLASPSQATPFFCFCAQREFEWQKRSAKEQNENNYLVQFVLSGSSNRIGFKMLIIIFPILVIMHFLASNLTSIALCGGRCRLIRYFQQLYMEHQECLGTLNNLCNWDLW